MRQTELSREWKMMQKIAAVFCAAILLTVLCAACKAKGLPDTYVEGSDYQYMQTTNELSYPRVQQGDSVTYFCYRGFLYYFDESTRVILPLCSRADCLHDRETDTARLADCNAYILQEDLLGNNTAIAYCNGYIYCIPNAVSEANILHRISRDGTKKDVIYKWEEGAHIEEWIIHRDILYYVNHTYVVEGDTLESQYSLNALRLSSSSLRSETIYTTGEELTVLNLGALQAYGNYIYFEIHAVKNSDEEYTTDEYFDYYMYARTMVYDTQNQEYTELSLPNTARGTLVMSPVFWQDRMILKPYDLEKDGSESMTVYIADLDGSNVEILFEDVRQDYRLISDGEYLYLTDSLGDNWRVATFYQVYNSDLQVIDTFVPPDYFDVDLRVGADSMIYPFDRSIDEDGNVIYEYNATFFTEPSADVWGVMVWDKSTIGTYHGGDIELTQILR